MEQSAGDAPSDTAVEKLRGEMRRFWDRCARDDPWFFVDNRLRYRRSRSAGPDETEFWGTGESDLDRLLGTFEVQIQRSDVVLEIGCGIGRLTRPLGVRAARVLALDISCEMLARARRENPLLHNVLWIAGDGVSLRCVRDESVDVCISHVVFQHIPDPRVTLGYVREIARVLGPHGWALFQLSTDPNVHRTRRRGIVEHIAALVGRAPPGQRHAAWLGSAVSVKELRGVASQTGLNLRIAGAGTQFSSVLATRGGASAST